MLRSRMEGEGWTRPFLGIESSYKEEPSKKWKVHVLGGQSEKKIA